MKYATDLLHIEMDSLRNQFLNTVEHGKVIFLIVDDRGRIDYISNYVEDILHFKPIELVGKNLEEITEPESVNFLKSLLSSSAAQVNKAVYFEDMCLHCSYCLLHYFDGIMVGKETSAGKRFVLYLHDVTDRKTEAEKLSQLNIELDSFIYKASHDLRAPLLSIKGLINITEKTIPTEFLEYTQMMARSVERLDKFVTQLATYSRNSNVVVNNSRINFNDLFIEVVENYRFLPNAERIRFYIDTEKKADSYSDNFRLKIILNNLVSNAIKYHTIDQPFPFIRLRVTGDAHHFKISVTDNGQGIAEEYIHKIFGMFKRASDSSDGSGLGLYIVKKALSKLGGEIEVNSKVGIGTTFTVIIPNGIENCGIEIQTDTVKIAPAD